VIFFSLSERGNFGLGTSITDLSMAGDVISASTYSSRMHTFGPHVRPDVMKGVIGEVQAMVAHRLHAQIFAWSMNTPLLGLSYERKSDAFLDEVGAKRLDLRRLDLEDVVAWLDLLSPSKQRA
jgi:polysaccharide pyruvyl transferase WcaK-like protein